MLVQNHTVAENVALGYEEAPFFFPLRIVHDRINEFSERYGLRLDPDERIWRLSAGEQQRVEIAKTLLRGADLLILDEPTSVLTSQETEELFTILRQMSGSGRSVIFISHKLEEVLALCHRVAVLRKGEIVGSARTNKVSKRELARMMVGRDILFDTERKALTRGELILDVQNLTVLGDRRETAVDSVSFQIFANEILGIAGIAGNGQRELIEAITGLRNSEKGRVILSGKDITNVSARAISDTGVAHVPEERIRFGSVPNLIVAWLAKANPLAVILSGFFFAGILVGGDAIQISLGLTAAIFAGSALAGIHAFVSVSLKANQVVSGLALTMLGLGISGLVGKPYIGRPLSSKMVRLPIPLLQDIPVLGKVLFSHDAFFYLAIILGILLWFILFHTRWGIEIRSVGENPAAAETRGINISVVRYLCTMIGGSFAGMAGAHL